MRLDGGGDGTVAIWCGNDRAVGKMMLFHAGLPTLFSFLPQKFSPIWNENRKKSNIFELPGFSSKKPLFMLDFFP